MQESAKTPLQFGGVALIAIGEIVHRIVESGKDERKLGRWVWIRIQGKHNQCTRIISGYRPNVSHELGSVYQQQIRYLEQEGETKDPLTVFDEDLSALINSWKESGDEIILGMDSNEDVRWSDFSDTLQELHMQETICMLHGNSGPATQQTNENRKPIDGIWTTINRQPTRGGYLPFGDGISSDHRFTWIDIDRFSLYNASVAKTKSQPKRRFRSDDPVAVQKYTDAVHAYFTQLNLYRQLDELYKYEEWDDERERTYNKILKLSNRIKKTAEKVLRKIRNGAVEWSPKLQAVRNKVDLFICVLKKKRGGRVCRRLLARKERKAGIFDTKELTISQAHNQLKDILKEYKQAKTEAGQSREKIFELLCDRRAKRNNTTKEQELKKLQNINRQQRLSRKVNTTRAKKQRTATIRIFRQNESGDKVECFSAEEVETACINENKQRFTQNSNTPFLNEPLVHDIGYLAENDAAEQILQGSYQPPPTTDKFTRALIQELSTPPCIQETGPITTVITPEDNKKAWQKQKEKTASNGLHFGHYKASAQHEQLNKFDAQTRTIPYKHGFAPQEWTEITDVEILKKSGVFEVELMRTIQLLDSQFNMNNKKLGRELMCNAERHGLLAEEQAGSRKHRRAALSALNKRLTMDIMRQKKKSGVIISNDAKSCYDRVAHNVAILAMRRLGAPKSAVTSMFQTFQKATHRVRTAFGDSALTYDSSDCHIPLQGIAQGNGCAPTGWVCISTPLIKALKTAGYGAILISALTVAIVSFVCYAFVDDTDLVHTARSNQYQGTRILEEAQCALDHWEGCLHATGGP